MVDLRTDYKDDLLDTSVNTQRKYNVVNNDDGTVSFEDATVYAQNGDTFGASEVNQIHAAVNLVNESLTADNGTNFRFGYNSDTDKYGYYVADSEGADTFFPFKGEVTVGSFGVSAPASGAITYTVTKKGTYTVMPVVFNTDSKNQSVTVKKNGTAVKTITFPFCYIRKGTNFDLDLEENDVITIEKSSNGDVGISMDYVLR